MLPVVRELEADYADRLNVQILDYFADETRPLLSQYRIRYHPGFVILGRDGTPTWTHTGPVPRETLVEKIEAALA